MMKKTLTAVALACGLMGVAQAQGSKVELLPIPSTLPPALQIAAQGGMNIEKSFKADGGMTGWLMYAADGQYAIAYTPPSGDVVVAGRMLSAKGEDLTKRYLDELVNYDRFLPRIEKSKTVDTGATGKDVKATIWAFMDTNCIYCHYASKALKAYEAAGLQVRWIPVAILGPDSAGQAAAIMTAKNPTAALEEHENTWNPRAGQKGITPMPNSSIPEAIRKELNANVTLMGDLGGKGTPLIVFKDARGHLQRVSGMPNLKDLPRITGLPEQEITDKELQRFR